MSRWQIGSAGHPRSPTQLTRTASSISLHCPKSPIKTVQCTSALLRHSQHSIVLTKVILMSYNSLACGGQY